MEMVTGGVDLSQVLVDPDNGEKFQYQEKELTLKKALLVALRGRGHMEMVSQDEIFDRQAVRIKVRDNERASFSDADLEVIRDRVLAPWQPVVIEAIYSVLGIKRKVK